MVCFYQSSKPSVYFYTCSTSHFGLLALQVLHSQVWSGGYIGQCQLVQSMLHGLFTLISSFSQKSFFIDQNILYEEFLFSPSFAFLLFLVFQLIEIVLGSYRIIYPEDHGFNLILSIIMLGSTENWM